MLEPKIGDLVVLPQNSYGIVGLGVLIVKREYQPNCLVHWIDDNLPTWEYEDDIARCIVRELRSVSSTG